MRVSHGSLGDGIGVEGFSVSGELSDDVELR